MPQPESERIDEGAGMPRTRSKSSATSADGTWVGWTYWHGGGKHGEPGEVEWMDDAYDVTLTEEQKMVTVRTFTAKPKDPNDGQ